MSFKSWGDGHYIPLSDLGNNYKQDNWYSEFTFPWDIYTEDSAMKAPPT